MILEELAAVRVRLEAFAVEVFAPLARVDQRVAGATAMYVQGLLLDGRCMSMQPMAERLGVGHQGLQQFVSFSTWDVAAVWVRLARWAVEVLWPKAWVVDGTGFSKDGRSFPGVAWRYRGTWGKVGNCQIGVSVSAVTAAASCPLDWRLFLPTGWDEACASDAETVAGIRQRRACVDSLAGQRHRPKRQLALDMRKELAGWALAPPVVVAGAGYSDNADFRGGLTERGLGLHRVGRGGADRLPPARYRTGRWPPGVVLVTWREGSGRTGDFVFSRAAGAPGCRRPVGWRADDGLLPKTWLLAQWPPHAAEPTDDQLSHLGADIRPA